MAVPAKSTLADQVARQLRAEILTGAVGAGQKLQPEIELAARFQVNRFTVREALNRLEQMHLIARRAGAGTVVLDYTEHASVDVLEDLVLGPDGRVNPYVVGHLLEMARLLSADLVGLAAERRSAADVTALRAVVARMEHESSLAAVSRLDFDFHWALAGAGGNLVPRLVLNSVRGLLRKYAPLLETLYLDSHAIAEGYSAVVDAISGRDPDRARSLVQWIWTSRHSRFVDLLEQGGRRPDSATG